MKTKTFTASSMVEAMSQIQAEFGERAVIIRSSVKQTKGFLGLFKKNIVEVVAGVEQSRPVSLHPKIEPEVIQKSDRPVVHEDEVLHEVQELKQLVKQLKTEKNKSEFPKPLQSIYKGLVRNELSPHLANEICNAVFEKIKSQQVIDDAYLLELTEEQITTRTEAIPFGGVDFDKKWINIVGPTGVGKTTTIAKIAARALLEHKKKIAFITTDTYRIAAIEQLKTYANLLQAPVEVVYNREDFEAAMQTFEDFDCIFVDTAGRNYKDGQYIEDLQEIIPFNETMENYLVLSATSKGKDMRQIIEQFQRIAIKKLIFTKMDESDAVGEMINLMIDYQMGVAYITNGQEVPEDLEEAQQSFFVDHLLKGVNCDEA